MADCMLFPNSWGEFLEAYSFKDKEEVYTNGSMLIPVFRVEQMVEHYFQNRWIPVSERLPGKNGDYLVFKSNHYGGWCEVAGFAKDGREVDEYDLGGCENVWYDYDSEYGYIAFDSVTHWMPLPEPPREE